MRGTAAFLLKRPWLHRAVAIVVTLSGAVIAVFAVLFEQQIQALRWHLWVLCLLVVTGVIGQLVQMGASSPALRLDSMHELLRELQAALALRRPATSKVPTYEEWRCHTEKLMEFIERQATAVADLPESYALSANLMVRLSTEELEHLNSSGHHPPITYAFEPDVEGILKGDDLDCYLLMVVRGPTQSRAYELICLRVPKHEDRSLPGAPRALRACLRRGEQFGDLGVDYVPHPRNSSRIKFGSGTNVNAQNSFISYFAKYPLDIASFVSIGLMRGDECVGVLNIDSTEEDFLADSLRRELLESILLPYAELAGAAADEFRTNLTTWMKRT